MKEQKIPEVKLEKLCTNPNFKIGEINVKFGISDFGGDVYDVYNKDNIKTGFFVKKGNELNAVNLRGLGLEDELYLPKECLTRVQCMQVHQDQEDKNRFGMIFGMASGCCDGAVLGGIYTLGASGKEDNFEVILARQVPFNIYGVAGAVHYHKKESFELDAGFELFALGSGCDGCGVQYLREREKRGAEQEYIYNNSQLKIDEHIISVNQRRMDHDLYDFFQKIDSLSIVNGALTAAHYVNIEKAYKVTKEYYIAKELQKKLEEGKTADNKSSELKGLESKIEYIDNTLAIIRNAVSQSSFINRNLYEVYP